MALVECPECGKEVSNIAPACPSCGLPLRTPRRYKNSRGIMLIFWLIVITFGIVLIGASGPWGVIIAVIGGIMFLGTIFDVMRGRR